MTRWWLALGILTWLLADGGWANPVPLASPPAPPPASPSWPSTPSRSCADNPDAPGHAGERTKCQPAAAAALTRGINITAWFRFPASRDPAALAAYLSDQALADIRTAGFDFVRLAVDPAVAETQRPVLIAAIKRIQRQGLTVVISPQPHDWHLETDPADRERLRTFWQTLAPALRPLDPARTVPEVLNEPVFPQDPTGWATLQHQILTVIRQALPNVTVVLTGQDWGSIGGLLALTPEADPNVLYSFHFYDPAELTSLAAYRPGLDRAALARLPFPVIDRPRCDATADGTADSATRDLMRYYCALGWDVPRIAATIDQAATWGRLHHVRLLAGEFGASTALNAPARTAWLKTVRAAFEARGIGWALWGYDDVMGLAVSRPPSRRPALDRAVLYALHMTTRM
ncbi:glycoside hydrolase family 5 protein [Acidisphaera sp. S103]|uniref:glycoside hydrolase family 5 protein n=1 Tax=Acidisphaera sp. S103 TaxID=1747223 RepID=UPI00131BDFE9|nr:cellulase family glycosylhydrolase [Acidisphaera sp. S103]